MATSSNAHRRVALGFIIALAVGVSALACFARTAGAVTLPAPSILSGPTEGQTINTDSTQFVFQYLDPITGGTLTGYTCTVDALPPVACNSGLDLVGLAPGAHTLGVKATIDLLGGQPVCVLTVCIDPGPISVDTDVLSRTFNVDLGGATAGTGGNNGAGGANGANGVNGTDAGRDRTAEFLVAWTKYKNQRALCRRMKQRIKRYKSRSNRTRAAKRHKKCVRRQNTLRAAALAVAK